MSRFKVASVVSLAVVAILAAAASANTLPEPSKGRGVVMFIGDSNITFGAGSITLQSTFFGGHRDVAYTPVFEARPGAGLKTSNCAYAEVGTCTAASDYWDKRLPSTLSKVTPAAIVVNLGVNDTIEVGTASTRGYSYYGKKVDEFMRLLPPGVPVFWTNLPCTQIAIGSPSRAEGCKRVNYAVGLAVSRWANLTIVNWALVANAHPEYFDTAHVHYTPGGYTKWADVVLAAVDAKVVSR